MAAQYLAVRYPELVRTLTLGVTLSRMNETVTAAVNGWVKSAGSGDIGAVVNDMIPILSSHSSLRNSDNIRAFYSESPHCFRGIIGYTAWVKSAGSGDIGAVVNDMIPKMYSDSYMKKYKRLLPVISKFTKLTSALFITRVLIASAVSSAIPLTVKPSRTSSRLSKTKTLKSLANTFGFAVFLPAQVLYAERSSGFVEISDVQNGKIKHFLILIILSS